MRWSSYKIISIYTRITRISIIMVISANYHDFITRGEQCEVVEDEASSTRDNIGIHTYSVILNFFVERPDFTRSLMSTKKQLNIIVNNKQRT